MELWVIWRERRDDIEAWGRGIIRPTDRPSTVKFLIEIASVLLITGGIVGELWIGVRITSINGDLRSKNAGLRSASGQLVALATLEAEQAKERTARIQAAMMLRNLSKQQGDALCSAIPKSHINEVMVTSSSQDWESFRYAQDFSEALRRCTTSAGLEPSGGVGNSFWSQNVPFGIWIRYQKHLTLDDPRSPNLTINPIKRRAFAWAIRDVLEAHGVKVEGVTDEAQTVLDIFVGPRRPPTDAELETVKPSSSSPATNH